MFVESHRIIPECYGDTVFIEVLGYKNPTRALNINEVLKSLASRKPNNKSIGIVDNDKKAQKFLGQYDLIESPKKLDTLSKIKLYTNHLLIIIKPELEPFLRNCAQETNINPSDYGFCDIKLLENACKDFHTHKNDRLKNFLNTLKQKQHPAIVQIQNWI